MYIYTCIHIHMLINALLRNFLLCALAVEGMPVGMPDFGVVPVAGSAEARAIFDGAFSPEGRGRLMLPLLTDFTVLFHYFLMKKQHKSTKHDMLEMKKWRNI